MTETWIVRMCQSICRRRIAVCVVVFASMLLFAGSNTRYVANFANGPYPMSGTDLDRLGNPELSPRYFAQVSGTKTIDTGLQEISIKKRSGKEVSRSVSASYVALEMGDKYLIVKTPSGASKVFEGELAPFSSEFERNFFQKPEMLKIRDRFYPFYLKSGSFRERGYIAIGIGVVMFVILLWVAIPSWKYLRNPETHPLVRRVSAWGDPIGIPADIEREYGGNVVLRLGNHTFTEHYVIMKSVFGFDVFRISDLLWAHKLIQKTSIYYVIPAGKSFFAKLFFPDGEAVIGASETLVDSVLNYAAERTPWAVFGYSPEIQTLFAKNPAEFRAIVESRKHAGPDGAKAEQNR